MPPHFSDLLSSEPIEVVAESGQKRFIVHSGTLATQSEAAEKKIDLSDWDGDTVKRFFQFLYSGDYQFPELVLDEEDEEDEVDESGEGEQRDGADTPDTVQSFAVRGGWRFGDTNVNVILVHAKVYTLAQYRGVETLQAMALERLRTALGAIDGRMFERTSKVANVIEVLGYVYSNTDSHEEPMRDLLSAFAAGNIEKLMSRGEMALLLAKEGDFAVELTERMVGRLCGTEKKLSDVERELQDWKDLAAVSDKKVLQLEAASIGGAFALVTKQFNRTLRG